MKPKLKFEFEHPMLAHIVLTGLSKYPGEKTIDLDKPVFTTRIYLGKKVDNNA